MEYAKLALEKRIPLDDSITLPIDKETKRRLEMIRSRHNVRHLEWVRCLIWEELPKLEEAYPIE